MSLFLDRSELEQLTGKRTRPAQIRQLRASKIPHEVNARGQVLVARAYVEQRLGVNGGTAPAPTGYAPEPDFSAFEARG